MQSITSIRTATAADAEMLTEFARRVFYEAFAPMNSPGNMEAYYRKCGFEVVGSHIFQMGDEAQNDLWMERRLQEPSQ